MITPRENNAITRILNKIGARGPFRLHPIKNGANNRSFRAVWGEGEAFLKIYFKHAGDRRDRLGTEYSFSKYGWNCGAKSIPRPLASAPRESMALYEYIHGSLCHPSDLTPRAIAEALEFYQRINHRRKSSGAARLASGSEASFSLRDHIGKVERRLARLRRLRGKTGIERAAVSFIRKDLTEEWRNTCAALKAATRRLGLSWTQSLPLADRCISPSDFGFHNALRVKGGRFRFFDFEYAGWDDPAKMICDFFCQPKVPVPTRYLKIFTNRVAAGVSDPSGLKHRVQLLMPVYRIKWCCIMLNEFLPVGRERRRFANRSFKPEVLRRKQLNSARRCLKECRNGLY